MQNDRTLKDLLHYVREGGDVKRFHRVYTTRDNTVAEHSFGVAWLCYLLCDGKPSGALIMAALSHDLAEQTFGDIPAPAKRQLGIREQVHAAESSELESYDLKFDLTKQEERTLKLADLFDQLCFCKREIQLGNQRIQHVSERCSASIEALRPVERELAVYHTVQRLSF